MTEYSIEDDLYERGLDEVLEKIRQDAPKHISNQQVRADTENQFDMTLKTVVNAHETWISQNSLAPNMSSAVATILLQQHRIGLITLLTMGKGVSQSTAEQIVDNHILVHK